MGNLVYTCPGEGCPGIQLPGQDRCPGGYLPGWQFVRVTCVQALLIQLSLGSTKPRPAVIYVDLLLGAFPLNLKLGDQPYVRLG